MTDLRVQTRIIVVTSVWLLVLLFALSGQPLVGVAVGLGCCWLLLLIEDPLLGIPIGALAAWGAWLQLF